MHKVSIRPQWTLSNSEGVNLSPRLLDLLADVHEHGSLSGACRSTGASYRHAWNLIRQGETQMGIPLLNKERGKGSTLTPLGEKLVWAGHRIAARLTPMLETLASELEGEITQVLSHGAEVLRVHASHGFAVEKLLGSLAAQGGNIERRYVGSVEAVASLHAKSCDLAGFHIPVGEFEERGLRHYERWLNQRHSRIIHVATRHQGLMVAPGNPLNIHGVEDLARTGLRFVNRQPTSGTRFLLECLLHKAGTSPRRIGGYELAEFTHAAVAAYVASGMADVGFGVETPARRFKLEFIPLAKERYFLLCHESALADPMMQAALAVLRSEAFKQSVNDLPGYSARNCGEVQTLPEAFPDLYNNPSA